MIQREIERLVAGDRFSMPALYDTVWPLIEAHDTLTAHAGSVRRRLEGNYRRLGYSILRHVFLIELVKVPKIETTKFRVRWYEQLNDDPRFCSFDECVEIAADLLSSLVTGWLDVPDHLELFNLCFEHGILPYEVPVDYVARPAPGDNTTRIHRRGNLEWMCTDTMLRTLKLRKLLTTAATSPDVAFFRKVIEDKIQVKTYLTDRAQTGPHKTNREKRWETHPQSVQFADRRSCLAIEYVLIRQLCAFEGFPEQSRQRLQAEQILPADLPTHNCPITLSPMSFPAFQHALMNPRAGRSDFQVGHLNPLKLDAEAGDSAGHTAENISWISADGNRIQGSLSLADVRALLRRIASNYEVRGWV